MNKKGDLELKDFGAIFVIYILILTTIATSTNLSISENLSLPSQKEDPTQYPIQEPSNSSQENPTEESSTQRPASNSTIPESNQTTQANQTNQTSEQENMTSNQTNQSLSPLPKPNQTNQSLSPLPESNQTNQTLFITPESNQTSNLTIKTELIQGPAKVGENVIWTKRVYTNDTSYEIQIPKNAKKITKSEPRSFSTTSTNNQSQEYKEVVYETPAPQKLETNLSKGREILIYSEDHIQNVTANISISSFNLTESKKDSISLYWVGENRYLDFNTADNDNDSILDEMTWVVPHLSNQTFKIIIITKASLLDQAKNFLEDIFDFVSQLDGVLKEVLANQYVRVTFERNLTNKNDITIYAKSNDSGVVEVYEKNGTKKLGELGPIESGLKKYQLLLTKLNSPQNTFDLKVVGAAVFFDLIIDPIVTDVTSIAQIYQNGVLQDLDTETSIDFNQETIVGSKFSHPSNSVLQFQEDGWYKISYGCLVEETAAAGNRQIQSMWLENQSGAEILPSRTYTYLRNDADGQGDFASMSAVTLYNASSGDNLTVQSAAIHGTRDIDPEESCWLYAEKLHRPAALARETTDYDNQLTTTSQITQDLGQTVYEDTDNFAVDLTNNWITVKEDGWYKIYYVGGSEQTVGSNDNDRVTPASYLYKNNATEIEPSMTYSYHKRADQADFSSEEGATMAYLNSGENVSLRRFLLKDQATTPGQTYTIKDSWLMLEKIDGSDILTIWDTAGGQQITGSAATKTAFSNITWDSQVQVGASYSHTLGSAAFTIDEDGWFEISYAVSFDGSPGSNRKVSCARLTQDGIPLEPSHLCEYERDSLVMENSVAGNFVVNNTAGMTYTVQQAVTPQNNGGGHNLIADSSWVTVTPIKILDVTSPNVSIISPTQTNYTTQNIWFKVSANDSKGMDSCWYNIDNGANTTMSNSLDVYSHQNTSVSEGLHIAYFFCNDTSGNINDTETVSFGTDAAAPTISFEPPTPQDGASSGNSFFTINTTIVETNLKDITYFLYNSTGLVNQTSYPTMIKSITFQNLPTENYYYNVTVTDKIGQSASTETRSLYIDSENPLIDFSGTTPPSGSIISGSEISYGVTVTEDNEKNITFSLFGPYSNENTYTNSKRTISWTLLPDGFYEYNVTVFDAYNHSNSTQTRNITLDNQLPNIEYISPTENNNTYKPQNWIFANTSITEENFENVTYSLYNNSGIVYKNTFYSKTEHINWTSLPNAIYYYNVTVFDKAENSNVSETRLITLDTISPTLNFVSPTESDDTNLSQDWIFINTTITETNFQNITFSLYDSTGLLNQTTYSDSTRAINFTNLESKIYWYNVTVADKAGNTGDSSTRQIGLDLEGPAINIIKPEAKSYGYNTNLPLNATATDSIAGLDSCWYNIDDSTNKSITCNSATTFNSTDGQHTLYFFANDTFGNIGTSHVTFLISTAGPAVSLDNPENDTFYSSSTNVLFNYSTTDLAGVESCSLYGTWNGGWHLNQTDFSYGLLWNRTTRTCDAIWGDCGVENNVEVDNTFDSCSNNAQTDEKVNDMWLSATQATVGSTLNITCEFDSWSNDDLYIWYYNGTGWKNIRQDLDITSGTTVLNKSTTFTVDNVTGTQIIRCGLTYNQATETDECADTGSYYDNDDINFTVVAKKEKGNFSTNLSTEGNYEWNVECNDSLGYVGTAINNYSLGIDLTSPLVDFSTGTAADSSRLSSSQIFVDANVTELNFKNITFYLYNSTSQLRESTFTDNTRNITWSSLSDGTYYYNITVSDKTGKTSNTTTRSIELDTTSPTGSLVTPEDDYFTNNATQNLTGTFNDLFELKDATLYIFNSTGGLVYSSLVSLAGLTSATIGIVYTFLYDDVFSWFYQIRDSVNNEFNTTSNSIEIDSTAPEITFISPTEDNDEIVLQDYITVNTSVYEKNYKNITFWLYNDEGIVPPSPNTFSDSTRSINWTTLSDDIYYYNVSSYDLSGNIGYSETRTITLDTTAPELSFISPTEENNSVITGTEISLEISATELNEKNITFYLYNETGSIIRQNTFLDGRRAITWTFISDGKYFYNATMIDKVGQLGSTETRTISIDNVAPIISYELPTENTNENKSQNWIFINTSIQETNPANLTFTLYNQTSLVSSETITDTTRSHNFTYLTDEIYYYNVTVFDKAGQSSSTSTRKITLDTISPEISFVSPTENDGVIRNRDWVFINTTLSDKNFKQLTFNIYDSSGLVDSQAFTNETKEYNFTLLPDENYQYNVTAIDFSGNTNSTETRTIGLDSEGPIVNIEKPRSKTYGYNESLPLEYTASDRVSSLDACWYNLDNGPNQTITCNVATTFNTTVDSHTLYLFSNDTFGNVGSDEVSFFISITGPAIELVAPENDTFFSVASDINFSFSAFDPDGVDTCSLYGDWNGGWHKNETYSGGWQDVGFKHRKNISISNTGSTELADFPTYINIPSGYTSTGDYSDIKFFNGSCSENQSLLLAYELETYNSSSADFWLRVPEIPTSGQTVCMYYGNDNAEDSTNSTGVWDSDYGIVYHMDMAGQDSTSNNRDKVADVGTPSADNSFLGYGVAFSDGNAWDLRDIAYWEAGYSTRTHEAVFKTSTDVNTRQVIFAEGGGTNGIMMYIYNGDLYARWWISSQDNYVLYPISSNTKYHAVMSYENPGNYSLYINGELAGTGAASFDIAAHSGNGGIGYTGSTSKDFQDANSLQGHYFLGSIYEVRATDVFETQDEANQTYQSIFNQQSIVAPQTEENFTAFQIPFSEEGTYHWNVECNDTIGYSSFALDNYSFILDVTDPQVFFGTNTEANETVVGRNWVFLDANIIENNFKNITFYIYNETGLINSDSFTDSTRETNFTGLASGTYYYNITVFDRADRMGNSETRQISLDLSPPTGGLDTPLNNSYLGQLSQTLKGTFSDATGLYQATLYVLNETGYIIYSEVVDLLGALASTVGITYSFPTEGIYSWFYQVEDSVGNKMNTTSNILTIDTTPPTISFTTGTEESGRIFKRENIFINTTSSDTYWENITFNLYDSDEHLYSNTFTGNTRQINYTLLPDDTYFYNVTAQDKAGNSNSTETRNLTLDNLAPTIDFSGITKPNGALVSGDEISVEVLVTEANEANITFFLYNSTGSKIKENTFTDGRRTITWNLLSEGTYYYNATIIDRVSLSASTTTRTITIDDTAPRIDYGFGTLKNNSYVNQDWLFLKATITEDNFQNVTFRLYNSSGQLNTITFTNTTREYNFTGLTDTTYWYNIITQDKAGNSNSTQTRYATLDSLSPTIEFTSPTESNNFNKTENWIFINTTITDINFQNITFALSDETGIVNKTTYTNSIRSINFTELPSKIYWYNVTTQDKAGNFNSTETRKIGIDYLGPSIQIINPRAKAYGYNESLPLNYNVADAIVGADTCWYNLDNTANKTVDCSSSATFNTSDGQHTLHFFANDTLGNIGYKNVTFLISTTGPAIQLIAPEDESFYSQATEISFNYTTVDPDGVDTCSLYGDWNGGWHLNQTDSSFGLLGNDSTRTCDAIWGDCGVENNVEVDNTFDSCSNNAQTDEKVNDMWLSATQATVGSTLNITCEFDSWSNDDLYIWYYNGTGWKNIRQDLDITSGTTVLNKSTTFTVDNVTGTQIIRCGLTYNQATETDECADTGSYYDNDDINFTVVAKKEKGNFSTNLSTEGNYEWNVLCNDTLGYTTSAVSNYTITFDVTDPVVNFGTNTLSNNSNVSQNYIYINSSIIENNFRNMTFFLYNETGLASSHFQNDTDRDYTFTNLNDGTYFYNITVYDSASRSGNSPTRKILLDTTAPTGNNNNPSSNSYTNNATQNLTATLSDENGLAEAILYIFNSTGFVYNKTIQLAGQLSVTIGSIYTFLADGIYTWFYQAEDIVGNKYNTTNSTLILDTTPPQINLVPATLPNNSYVSKKYVYFNSSITEINFKNITFSLYNGEGVVGEYTFANSKRDINYTNLADDEYFYNVKSSDRAGNTNTSETRTITLDNLAPTINYAAPTEINTANKSQDFIFINTSVEEINFANITFRLYLGETLQNTTTYHSKIGYINFTELSDGEYTYNVTTTDMAGQSTSTPSRKITLDTTPPILFFIDPTEDSGTELEQENITLNTFLTETNFKNITFYLYNKTKLINETTFTTPTTQITFTASGENITYFYNATVFDTAGNQDSTATRNITLIDTTPPTIAITSPQNKTYYSNLSLSLTYSSYDLHKDSCWYNLNSGQNITMPNCQGTTLDVPDEQSSTITVYVNDTLGYTTSDNVTFFVNTSLINTPTTYTVQRGSSFTDGTTSETIEEMNPTNAFIIHTVRASSSDPATLQVTSDFTDSEEIKFTNYESGGGAMVEWSVIGGPDITVQRGEISYTNELSIPLSIGQLNLSNSFIIVNNRLNSTSQSENIDGFWTAKFTDDSNINFTRSSSSVSGVISYQVVSWEGTTVQRGSAQMLNTESTKDISISQINQNQTFMIFSRRSNNTLIENSMSRGFIKNSTSLEFRRTGSTGALDIEWFTIESEIFNAQHGNHAHAISSSPQYSEIPDPLVNTSRTFDIHSNDNEGSSTSFATAALTQNIYNKTAVVLQKAVATGAGTTSWSAIEITEKDSPKITLEFPEDSANISGLTIETLNFSVQDESEIINCSLYGNWSGGWHLNQTIQSPEKEITINFSSIKTDSDGYYKWNVKCTDAYQNTGFATNNFTFAAFLPPTKPTVYDITQSTNDGTGNITILWNSSNHSMSYKIYSGATIPTMAYMAETTELNYTDISFPGKKRRFYKVIATNPTGQNSSDIFGAHLYELRHNMVNSKNWIAFPSNISYLANANQTINEVPHATALTTFNSTTQSRVTCNNFSCPESLSCTATNCNFKLEAGIGYELNINTSLSQEVNWSAVGKVNEPQTINLTKNITSFGKNWIAIYANTTLSNAQGLIGDIPNADAISRWKASAQSSSGLIPSPFPWIPGFIGDNFQLNLEEGYEVSVTSSTQWTQN